MKGNEKGGGSKRLLAQSLRAFYGASEIEPAEKLPADRDENAGKTERRTLWRLKQITRTMMDSSVSI